jgi:hypothetical protein
MYRTTALVLGAVTLFLAACSSGRSGAGSSGTAGVGGLGGSGTAGYQNAGTGGGGGASGASALAGNSGSGRDGAAGSGSGAKDGGSDVSATDSSAGADGGKPCPPFEAGATTSAGDSGVNGCDRTTWSITANYTCDSTTNPACGFCGAAVGAMCAPQNAIDGDPNTRYTDGHPQTGGEYVILHFGGPVTIDGVEIVEPTASDRALGVEVEYSVDGVTFVPFCPAVTYTFIADPQHNLYAPVSPLDLSFPQSPLIKALKITQTGQASDGSWWSINEIAVQGCR